MPPSVARSAFLQRVVRAATAIRVRLQHWLDILGLALGVSAHFRPRPTHTNAWRSVATAELVRLYLTCKTRPAALQNGAAWTSARGQPYHRQLVWLCVNVWAATK